MKIYLKNTYSIVPVRLNNILSLIGTNANTKALVSTSYLNYLSHLHPEFLRSSYHCPKFIHITFLTNYKSLNRLSKSVGKKYNKTYSYQRLLKQSYHEAIRTFANKYNKNHKYYIALAYYRDFKRKFNVPASGPQHFIMFQLFIFNKNNYPYFSSHYFMNIANKDLDALAQDFTACINSHIHKVNVKICFRKNIMPKKQYGNCIYCIGKLTLRNKISNWLHDLF